MFGLWITGAGLPADRRYPIPNIYRNPSFRGSNRQEDFKLRQLFGLQVDEVEKPAI